MDTGQDWGPEDDIPETQGERKMAMKRYQVHLNERGWSEVYDTVAARVVRTFREWADAVYYAKIMNSVPA